MISPRLTKQERRELVKRLLSKPPPKSAPAPTWLSAVAREHYVASLEGQRREHERGHE